MVRQQTCCSPFHPPGRSLSVLHSTAMQNVSNSDPSPSLSCTSQSPLTDTLLVVSLAPQTTLPCQESTSQTRRTARKLTCLLVITDPTTLATLTPPPTAPPRLEVATTTARTLPPLTVTALMACATVTWAEWPLERTPRCESVAVTCPMSRLTGFGLGSSPTYNTPIPPRTRSRSSCARLASR